MTRNTDTQRQRVLAALSAHAPRLLRTLSRELGKNDAYLHQYLNRGTPRRLQEALRHKLAELLHIDEASLRDDDMPATTTTLYANIPFINMEDPADLYRTAAEIEKARDKWVFHRSMLKQIHQGDPADLRLLKIRGDSMEPVLSDGDAVMINIMDGITSPPAIFALFDGDGIMVKQIEVIPDSDPILARISTANTQYSSYQRNLNDIRIIGRVIWFSRSLSH